MPQHSTALEQQTIALLAKACHCEPAAISRLTRLDEINLDSLGLTTVITELEESVGLQFSSEQLMRFTEVVTVEDVIAVIADWQAAPAHVSG